MDGQTHRQQGFYRTLCRVGSKKSKLKGMKFLNVSNIGEALNTSDNLDGKTSVNSSQNTQRN